MKLIYNEAFLKHDTGIHPENIKRLQAFTETPQTEILSGEEYLTLFHKKEYINSVKQACLSGKKLDSDTQTSIGSWEAGIKAVGACIMASQSGDFAIVRPPGHHAHPDHSGGFCIFNNIGIAVQRLVNDGKKVLIIDIDSHLGDGTENFFYRTDKVLYWSIHQDPAFPGGGTVDEIGENEGAGFTVNVPLSPGSGDDLFLRSLIDILPVAVQFSPDIVAVSAGFDGHQQDLLLNLRLSVNAYYEAGVIISDNFKNVFAVLEGGYNIEYYPKCLFNFVNGINREKKTFTEIATDSTILTIEDFDVRMDKLKKNLSEFWKI